MERADIKDDTLVDNMVQHMQQMLDEIESAVDFLNKNTSIRTSVKSTFERLSAYKDIPEKAYNVFKKPQSDKENELTYESIMWWREDVKKIFKHNNIINVFEELAKLEDTIQPIHHLFNEVVLEVEAEINRAIDIALGK